MANETITPPTDPTPTPATAELPGIKAATLDAGRAAFQQTVAEPVKRSRGRPITHGKYSAKKIPLAKVGNGPAPVLVDEAFSGGILPVDFEAPKPAVDEATLQALAEGLTGLIEDLGCGFLRAQVLKASKDTALAAEAAKGGKMSETTRKLIILGGVQCAKKYLDNLEYAPETALGCGLVLYASGIFMQARAITAAMGQGKPAEVKAA
jgi:hypothetical protein